MRPPGIVCRGTAGRLRPRAVPPEAGAPPDRHERSRRSPTGAPAAAGQGPPVIGGRRCIATVQLQSFGTRRQTELEQVVEAWLKLILR